jgi:hypothetical protein
MEKNSEGVELLHADGQIYTKKLTVTVRNLANEPESDKKLSRTVQWPLAASNTKDTAYSSQPPWEVPNYGAQLTNITILVCTSLASVAGKLHTVCGCRAAVSDYSSDVSSLFW